MYFQYLVPRWNAACFWRYIFSPITIMSMDLFNCVCRMPVRIIIINELISRLSTISNFSWDEILSMVSEAYAWDFTRRASSPKGWSRESSPQMRSVRVWWNSFNNAMVLLLVQAICSVLRTPVASIDHLSVLLTDSDASKVQWTLDCFNGMNPFGLVCTFPFR